ncbi:MAG: Ig-like domain-containing protein [Bacteroidales bacterium]|nr:Ig-like domain-containing protein [Bacteroidales bacterium]
MKKQLQEFLAMNYGRLLLLAMMIFIGQGAAFSQGTITVTTNTDAGAGSLRQAIADAVDGDVIAFDGAVTMITLESSLELGDKTLTIDGGGDVVLNRDRVDVDSFRLVTITGAPDKLVTITDITLQNGIAKDGNGGGLYADHGAGGKTLLEGVTFSNNKSLRYGGGAVVNGLTDTPSEVTNCVFTNNIVHDGAGEGDGGGFFGSNTIVSGCAFTNNEANDDGGALYVNSGTEIINSTFTGNIAGGAGGAVRIQRAAPVTGCIFDSNSCGDQGGGAVFAAYGYYSNCEFTNNTSGANGGAISTNNNNWSIDNCVFTGNSALNLGGAVYIDDGGAMRNSIMINNSAGKNGGGAYIAGKKAPADAVGCLFAYNTADSIGGGLFVAKANVINSTITKNYAAENGGALSGDGAWLLANSIVYDNDAAGTAKNIQVVSNTAATAATNCAIDATAYDAAGWAASNITTLTESPFVGGTGADSLMLPYSSPLIDAGSTDTVITDLLPATALNGVNRIINSVVDLGPYERLQSFVVTTDADDGAGSLRQIIADAVDGESIITFADGISTILVDTTLELGDKTLIIDGGGDVVLDGAFNADPLLDTLGVISITGVADKIVTIQNLTIKNGFAEDSDGGGLYADHSAGGKTILENVVFDNNTGLSLGGGLYLKGLSVNPSEVINCTFTGNYVNNGSGEGDGGGMWGQSTNVSGCTFTDNEAMDDGGAMYAKSEVVISSSTFTGNVAGDAAGGIRTGNATIIISNCSFDSNTATAGAGGGVFLARGTVLNSEFINNTAGGTGGAISANNNECIIDNSMFMANAANIGGAVYFDDGGMFSNCIVKNNTAVADGGGLYLMGIKSAPNVVGCVIANNTATAKGGGVYAVSGNVINSIVTANTAGTNGGAMTGETGPWFIANSIVWDNDATGADKNIEVVSNSATNHAANCAIDATAYNASWTAVNTTILNASPFVGGTGADSLYTLTSAGLIDAGTLEYGIAALLPEFDLDGNDRIQGNVDLGVYETEVISVLGVTLDLASLDLAVGETGTLVATIDPAEAGNKAVTWSSSDEGVATVADGVVTGVAAGSATITVTTVDGGFTATCAVNVSNAVTGVTLDQTAVTLEVSETVTLVATVAPADATNKTVGWVSGNEAVATVNNSGLVTAIAPGTATISVITMDGSFMATCQVTVTDPTVAVTGVSLDQSTLALEPAGTATLVATVAPAEATDKSVTWSTSDAAVATVADGVVTAVADGTCTITVTTTDGGFTATCDVTVETVGIEDHATGFRLYPNPVTSGKLFIEVSDPGIKAFEIYNVLGVVIHQEKVSIQKSYELDTPAMMKSGIYFVRMIKDQTISVQQFIVE